jgi:DNA-binding response OmpR family regulator
MGSASPAALLPLLLERLDAEAAPVLSGAEAFHYPQRELDQLLEAGLLTELAPLDELGPCDCGDDGCTQVVHRDGQSLWAVCPRGIATPQPLSAEDIREYRVEVSRFCQALREANRMDGDAITEFSRTICFLGQMRVEGRQVPVVLTRCLRSQSAESALFEIRGRLTQRPVIVLTPTPRTLDLHVLHHLPEDGLVLAAVTELQLSADSLALDRLRLERLLRPESPPCTEAMLWVDEAAYQACFRGTPLTMPPRAFRVLVLLVRQAMMRGSGYVTRDTIYAALWPDDGDDKMVYDRQIDDSVKELRRALDDVEDGAGRRLIETGRTVGYRLLLSPPDLAMS